MSRVARILNTLMLTVVTGGCGRPLSPPPNSDPPWPPLPETGFISGRPATEADMEAGNAIFVSKAGSQLTGKALDIEVPQFAIFNDAENRQRTRVVIVQAEEANGTTIIGYREVATNMTGLATLREFELLGRQVEVK